jgi:hypothetical protein
MIALKLQVDEVQSIRNLLDSAGGLDDTKRDLQEMIRYILLSIEASLKSLEWRPLEVVFSTDLQAAVR